MMQQQFFEQPRRPQISAARETLATPKKRLSFLRAVFYLLAAFPLGVCYFVLLVTGVAITISPLSYLITTLLVATKSIPANTLIHVGPYGSILIDGQFRLSSLLLSFIGTMVGIFILYISRIILNIVAYLWGQFARMMPGRQRVPQPVDAREFEGRLLN